jgi:hypothetical protein
VFHPTSSHNGRERYERPLGRTEGRGARQTAVLTFTGRSQSVTVRRPEVTRTPPVLAGVALLQGGTLRTLFAAVPGGLLGHAVKRRTPIRPSVRVVRQSSFGALANWRPA